MFQFQANWKTSAAGVCALLVSLGSVGSSLLSGDVSQLGLQLPAIAAALGLIFAQDAHPTK